MPSMLMLESSVRFLPQFFGAAARRRSPTFDHPYSGESEVLEPISSTNTRRSAASFPETSTLQAHLTNSSRSDAPRLRFLGEPQPAQEPPYGGHRQRHPARSAQEGGPLPNGGVGAPAHILFEQPLDDSVRLRRPPAALARGERLLVGREPAVALDRGRADAESAGGFGLGHAALDGGDNPGA